jgi:hypothetical protein
LARVVLPFLVRPSAMLVAILGFQIQDQPHRQPFKVFLPKAVQAVFLQQEVALAYLAEQRLPA